MKNILIFVFSVLLLGSIGCQNKGPVEKAGERVDEMIDNAKEGENILKEKGPMEKMGESIDESVNDIKNK